MRQIVLLHDVGGARLGADSARAHILRLLVECSEHGGSDMIHVKNGTRTVAKNITKHIIKNEWRAK
ncbi:MAG: hypothetical protein ACI8W3_001906 [Myxococcota bacterium]